MHNFNLVKNFFWKDASEEIQEVFKDEYEYIKHTLAKEEKKEYLLKHTIDTDKNTSAKLIVLDQWLIAGGALDKETVHITLG